jgi:WD40 repeat protein
MWDLTSGEQHRLFSGHGETVLSALVYSNGRLLVSGSGDGTARIWSVNTGSVVHVLKGDEAAVTSLAVSADNRLLATGGGGGLVYLWDATLGYRLGKLPVLVAPLRGLFFTEDCGSLVTHSGTHTVQVWRLPPLGQSLIDLAWDQYGRKGGIFTPEQRVRFNLAEPEMPPMRAR